MPHVVLLGDSILDNGAYVGGGPDVVRQLRARLTEGWGASLAAVDGARTADVAAQLPAIPSDASHLVVSAGGNDALAHAPVLQTLAWSMASAVERLSAIRVAFERDYRTMLDAVLARGLPTALCTIYEPRFPDARMQRLATTALAIFNDRILHEAFLRALPVIDLRLVCDEDADYANPIEPSAKGGGKIAAAVAGLVTGHDFGRPRAEIYVR